MTLIPSNKTNSTVVINVIPIEKHNEPGSPQATNHASQEMQLIMKLNKNNESKPEPIEPSSNYLSIVAIQKILRRFLIENSMPKEQLANTLEITIKNLDRLLSNNPPLWLIPKINLPLIKLYCETKFR